MSILCTFFIVNFTKIYIINKSFYFKCVNFFVPTFIKLKVALKLLPYLSNSSFNFVKHSDTLSN